MCVYISMCIFKLCFLKKKKKNEDKKRNKQANFTVYMSFLTPNLMK